MNKKTFDEMHPALGWMLTQVFFAMSLIFFRANTIGEAIEFIKQILYVDFTNIDVNILSAFQTPVLKYFLDGTAITNSLPFIYVGIYYFLALFIVLGAKNSNEKMKAFQLKISTMLWTAFLIVLSIFSLSGISTFLYFNF
jgi:alginate O-acetyltransferase complex protein AlgI